MFVNRKELPRCEFGTTNGYEESVCDEPAIAYWEWKTGGLYVCERHDLIVQNAESSDD